MSLFNRFAYFHYIAIELRKCRILWKTQDNYMFAIMDRLRNNMTYKTYMFFAFIARLIGVLLCTIQSILFHYIMVKYNIQRDKKYVKELYFVNSINLIFFSVNSQIYMFIFIHTHTHIYIYVCMYIHIALPIYNGTSISVQNLLG